MRIAALALLALAAATPAAAAGWLSSTSDDGTWFHAFARSAGEEVEIACGGRSTGEASAEAAKAPVITGRGELRLSLKADLFVGEPPPRTVRVRVNRVEYALPSARYDRPRRAFVVLFSATDPVIEALGGARRFTVVPEDAGPIPVEEVGPALATLMDFCQARWAAIGGTGPDGPERAKAMAFAVAHTGLPDPVIRSLELVDLNTDGTPEGLLILGGSYCGARYCDGFVLDLSGDGARSLGTWPVATLTPGITKLNGWLDIEVNGAVRRFEGGRYDAR